MKMLGTYQVLDAVYFLPGTTKLCSRLAGFGQLGIQPHLPIEEISDDATQSEELKAASQRTLQDAICLLCRIVDVHAPEVRLSSSNAR